MTKERLLRWRLALQPVGAVLSAPEPRAGALCGPAGGAAVCLPSALFSALLSVLFSVCGHVLRHQGGGDCLRCRLSALLLVCAAVCVVLLSVWASVCVVLVFVCMLAVLMCLRALSQEGEGTGAMSPH